MSEKKTRLSRQSRLYWDAVSDEYQQKTEISLDDFHYGPLLPGDSDLRLLPIDLSGKRCLEIGSGAGQNSIYLSRKGAACVAVDISEAQLAHGRALASESGATVEYIQGDMDDAAFLQELGQFDLLHSVYAIPFSQNPASLLETMEKLLNPGGRLILVAGHPAYAGEWMELDEAEEGMMLFDYFHPPDDIRGGNEIHEGVRSRFYPISTMTDWIAGAGLEVCRILEPEPLPVNIMRPDERKVRVPYWSEAWAELYPILSRVPIVAIFECRKKGY